MLPVPQPGIQNTNKQKEEEKEKEDEKDRKTLQCRVVHTGKNQTVGTVFPVASVNFMKIIDIQGKNINILHTMVESTIIVTAAY